MGSPLIRFLALTLALFILASSQRDPPPRHRRENASNSDHEGDRPQPHPPDIPKMHPDQHSNEPNNKNDAPKIKRRLWVDWQPIEKFTICLVFVNVIYVSIFGYWVYLDQRGYIAILQVSRIAYDIGKPIRLAIMYINTGKTFAYIDAFQIKMLIGKPDPNRRINNVLPPLVAVDVPVEVPVQREQTLIVKDDDSNYITDVLKKQLDKGDLFIIVAIRVHYRDIFGIPHTNVGCDIWVQELNTFGICTWKTKKSRKKRDNSQ
jgi:hypothetical protein